MALRSPAALAALVLALAPAVLGAQDRQSERAFTLNERVPAGQWLRVRNVIGEVRVRAVDRRPRRDRRRPRAGDAAIPQMVRIETRKSPDGSILVCAFWTENATCDEDGYRSRGEGRVEPEQRRRGGLRGSPAEGRERRRVVGERRGERGGRDGRGARPAR